MVAHRARIPALALAAALVVVTPVDAALRDCWPPPVDALVRDPFRLPPCTWCPGNRGIEYDTAPGVAVRAVAGGTVSFAGDVAGVRYVVVRLPDGRRVTYGQLAAGPSGPGSGDRVVTGQVVGRTEGRLFLGLRAADPDDTYLDPAPLLGRPAWPARLVPTDGTAAPPAPPARLRCDPP